MERTIKPRVCGPGFQSRVYAAVSLVPPGRLVTYGDVAAALGDAAVARQVGWALAALTDDGVPWHRVINAQGRISVRGDDARAVVQAARLEAEGVRFTNGRCDLRAYRFLLPSAPTDDD